MTGDVADAPAAAVEVDDHREHRILRRRVQAGRDVAARSGDRQVLDSRHLDRAAQRSEGLDELTGLLDADVADAAAAPLPVLLDGVEQQLDVGVEGHTGSL